MKFLRFDKKFVRFDNTYIIKEPIFVLIFLQIWTGIMIFLFANNVF